MTNDFKTFIWNCLFKLQIKVNYLRLGQFNDFELIVRREFIEKWWTENLSIVIIIYSMTQMASKASIIQESRAEVKKLTVRILTGVFDLNLLSQQIFPTKFCFFDSDTIHWHFSFSVLKTNKDVIVFFEPIFMCLGMVLVREVQGRHFWQVWIFHSSMVRTVKHLFEDSFNIWTYCTLILIKRLLGYKFCKPLTFKLSWGDAIKKLDDKRKFRNLIIFNHIIVNELQFCSFSRLNLLEFYHSLSHFI